jgi:hypothetical protein
MVEKRGNMKLTHCGAHFGSARRDLSCWQIRNDDGTPATQDEIWAELTRLQSEVSEWHKLRDPVTLHVSLLRGFPARLDRATFLHIAGDEPCNVGIEPPRSGRIE